MIIFNISVYNLKQINNEKFKNKNDMLYASLFRVICKCSQEKNGKIFNVLSEQNITEHFFGVERSVLTEHLDPVFPEFPEMEFSSNISFIWLYICLDNLVC